MTKKVIVYFIALVFFGSLALVLFNSYRFLNFQSSQEPKKIIFEIEPKSTLNKISENLYKQNLISNDKHFTLYVKLRKLSEKLKVGEYELSKDMKPNEILDILVSGKSLIRQFTIPEGHNIFDIALVFKKLNLSSQADFMKLVNDTDFIYELTGEKLKSLEGYLFPETYSYTKYTSVKEIITQMYKSFQKAYSQIKKESPFKDWPRHQVVTLASIIEKETGATEERAIISSVFHNRLNKNMMLQTDPTVIYGKALRSGVIENKINREDLQTATEFNTYTMKGLPPGPIANPGFGALQAAVSPAETEYLFFVSQNDGTHKFSKTYEQHNQAVKKFQLDPKAREEKSWRDLNKNNVKN